MKGRSPAKRGGRGRGRGARTAVTVDIVDEIKAGIEIVQVDTPSPERSQDDERDMETNDKQKNVKSEEDMDDVEGDMGGDSDIEMWEVTDEITAEEEVGTQQADEEKSDKDQNAPAKASQSSTDLEKIPTIKVEAGLETKESVESKNVGPKDDNNVASKTDQGKSDSEKLDADESDSAKEVAKTNNEKQSVKSDDSIIEAGRSDEKSEAEMKDDIPPKAGQEAANTAAGNEDEKNQSGKSDDDREADNMESKTEVEKPKPGEAITQSEDFKSEAGKDAGISEDGSKSGKSEDGTEVEKLEDVKSGAGKSEDGKQADKLEDGKSVAGKSEEGKEAEKLEDGKSGAGTSEAGKEADKLADGKSGAGSSEDGNEAKKFEDGKSGACKSEDGKNNWRDVAMSDKLEVTDAADDVMVIEDSDSESGQAGSQAKDKKGKTTIKKEKKQPDGDGKEAEVSTSQKTEPVVVKESLRPMPAILKKGKYLKMQQLTVNIGPIQVLDLASSQLIHVLSLNPTFEIKFESVEKKAEKGETRTESRGMVRVPFQIQTPMKLIKVAGALSSLNINGRDMSMRFPDSFNKAVDECKQWQEENVKLKQQMDIKLKQRRAFVRNFPTDMTEEQAKEWFPTVEKIIFQMGTNLNGEESLLNVHLEFGTIKKLDEFLSGKKTPKVEALKITFSRLTGNTKKNEASKDRKMDASKDRGRGRGFVERGRGKGRGWGWGREIDLPEGADLSKTLDTLYNKDFTDSIVNKAAANVMKRTQQGFRKRGSYFGRARGRGMTAMAARGRGRGAFGRGMVDMRERSDLSPRGGNVKRKRVAHPAHTRQNEKDYYHQDPKRSRRQSGSRDGGLRGDDIFRRSLSTDLYKHEASRQGHYRQDPPRHMMSPRHEMAGGQNEAMAMIAKLQSKLDNVEKQLAVKSDNRGLQSTGRESDVYRQPGASVGSPQRKSPMAPPRQVKGNLSSGQKPRFGQPTQTQQPRFGQQAQNQPNQGRKGQFGQQAGGQRAQNQQFGAQKNQQRGGQDQKNVNRGGQMTQGQQRPGQSQQNKQGGQMARSPANQGRGQQSQQRPGQQLTNRSPAGRAGRGISKQQKQPQQQWGSQKSQFQGGTGRGGATQNKRPMKRGSQYDADQPEHKRMHMDDRSDFRSRQRDDLGYEDTFQPSSSYGNQRSQQLGYYDNQGQNSSRSNRAGEAEKLKDDLEGRFLDSDLDRRYRGEERYRDNLALDDQRNQTGFQHRHSMYQTGMDQAALRGHQAPAYQNQFDDQQLMASRSQATYFDSRPQDDWAGRGYSGY
ncbi:hypothetical protein MAR_029259 [Mya arenaria]|uniref:Uncharacterized protein n=1 Tax=Mya arenaria TaxID=6604 RepID=A0ABY7DFU7_MYAAR|nr:hypothetical protein MAR_029259 [Mya arenaria]